MVPLSKKVLKYGTPKPSLGYVVDGLEACCFEARRRGIEEDCGAVSGSSILRFGVSILGQRPLNPKP